MAGDLGARRQRAELVEAERQRPLHKAIDHQAIVREALVAQGDVVGVVRADRPVGPEVGRYVLRCELMGQGLAVDDQPLRAPRQTLGLLQEADALGVVGDLVAGAQDQRPASGQGGLQPAAAVRGNGHAAPPVLSGTMA
jgi:hypothetical protein